MVNHGNNNSSSSLSQTFQNESSYLNPPNNIPLNVGGGWPLPFTEEDIEKNNRMVMFHFAPGIDVIGELRNFADKYNAGIWVMAASGRVASATLVDLRRHHPDHNLLFPYAGAPTRTLQGPLTLVEFNGCYISGSDDPAMAAVDSYSRAALLSSDHIIHQRNKFGITFEGAQPGELVGGIVGGKIVAGSTGVMVKFTLFSKKKIVDHNAPDDNDGGVGDAGAGADADADGASGSDGENNNMPDLPEVPFGYYRSSM